MARHTLPARLRRIAKHMTWSVADMAEAVRAHPSTVSKWLSDGHTSIKAEYAFRLEDETGFCARWILLGEGPVHIADFLAESMPPDFRAEMMRHTKSMDRIVRRAKRGRL